MKKNIINKILLLISIIITIIFIYNLFKTNLIPFKYMLLIICIFILIYIIYAFITIKKHNKKILNIITSFIFIIINIFAIFIIIKINDVFNFLNNNLNNNYNTITYNIIVNNKSNYYNINDIKDINIYYYKDLEDDSIILNEVKDLKLNEYKDNVYDLLSKVISNNYVVLVSNSFYEVMIENDNTYEDNTRIIKSFELNVEKNEKQVNKDITNTSFILFINGIDTRSGTLPVRSLSDVNILMSVNPETKKILMTAIPRDYYVQLHGTSGLKDKLTHSGTYGGVNSTIKTIEDLFNLNIDYYARFNFNSVINLVDAVGGITLYSDVNYPFICHTNKNCTFAPGNNNVDGKCALAFARERKSYVTGDKHRGENQEQVITVLFNKIFNSNLIYNYSSYLKAMDNTFETNLSVNDITSLIKMQVDDMASWDIKTYNVSGEGNMTYTYSYPNQKLWVMHPNYKTVETAKEKINNILYN